MDDRIAALRNVALLQTLNARQLGAIASCCRFQRVPKGTVILEQGTPGLTMYVVLAGRFRVQQSQESGETATLAIRKAGDVLGEMSLLENAPRSASVVAVEPSRVLALSSADFEQHVLKNPETCLALLRALSRRLREASIDLVSMRSEPLPLRLVHYFENQDPVSFPKSQAEWAKELGCSREALSRNLRKLVLEGRLVHQGRGRYKWVGS